MLQVRQFVNSMFSSNTFVLFEENYNYCWLVDIGDAKEIIDVLPNGCEVKGLFLTHTHFDHIYGINVLWQAFPKMKVFTSAYGKKALYDAKLNLSYYHEDPIEYAGKEVTVLREGDEIEIFPDIKVEAMETPGHCPSCITYNVQSYLFTGDSHIPGLKVATRLPRADKSLALDSEKRIIQLSAGKTICSGHGKMVKM